MQQDFMPDDIYDSLDVQLAKFNSLGNVILMTDANARTHNGLDYIPEEDNSHVPTPPASLYNVDSVATFPRNNMDVGSNTYGTRFLETCRKVPLRICNGRKIGDLCGNYTCYHRGIGQSSIDYGANSPEIYENISYFRVKPPIPTFSDHTPVTLGLEVIAEVTTTSENHQFIPKPAKIKWNKGLAGKFKELLESPACNESLNTFTQKGTQPDQNGV
mgnify:CR=1 FL=1